MLYTQRSSRIPLAVGSGLIPSSPSPPKSHRFPAASAHPTASWRPPGAFVPNATPGVPYMPTWLAKLEPETKVHVPPVYSHRSLRRSEEHTSELQSRLHLVCRLLLEK